jgi:hypothetical protein
MGLLYIGREICPSLSADFHQITRRQGRQLFVPRDPGCTCSILDEDIRRDGIEVGHNSTKPHRTLSLRVLCGQIPQLRGGCNRFPSLTRDRLGSSGADCADAWQAAQQRQRHAPSSCRPADTRRSPAMRVGGRIHFTRSLTVQRVSGTGQELFASEMQICCQMR